MTERLSREEIKLALVNGHRMNPSRVDTYPGMWTGTPAVGSRWTVQQLAGLQRELNAAKESTSRFAHAVIARLRNFERVEAHSVDLETHFVECPLLARSKDRSRVLIIAPGGDKIWRSAR